MDGDNDVPSDLDDEGPTAQDLAAIVTEEPLIAAEVALVDAEIAVLAVDGDPTPLALRRLRRAQARVKREVLALRAGPVRSSSRVAGRRVA